MRHLLRGIQLTLFDRRFRPFVWKPMLASAFVFVAIVASGYALVVPRIQTWFERTSWFPEPLLPVFGALYVLAWAFLSGAVFLAIAGLVSSLLWERLSLEVERSEFGAAPSGQFGCAESLADSLARLPFSIGLAIMAMVFGWAVFGAVGIACAGLIGLSDFTANAYARRSLRFPGQFFRAVRLPGALGFAAACGLFALLPVVNVLLLPAMVAGGTLLVADSEMREPPVR